MTQMSPLRRHMIEDMAVAKSFRRLRRIGFDKAAIRVRQVHAKIMEPDLLARAICAANR